LPGEFRLRGNYPNPFNPSTRILFDVPQATWGRLEVFDVLGRRVSVLLEGAIAAGRHSTTWQPQSHLPSGVYFYSLTTPTWSEARSMMLLQ
jgi:hypothetical protein